MDVSAAGRLVSRRKKQGAVTPFTMRYPLYGDLPEVVARVMGSERFPLARFAAAATRPESLPLPAIPEVCFAGRSNVGKSRPVSHSSYDIPTDLMTDDCPALPSAPQRAQPATGCSSRAILASSDSQQQRLAHDFRFGPGARSLINALTMSPVARESDKPGAAHRHRASVHVARSSS